MTLQNVLRELYRTLDRLRRPDGEFDIIHTGDGWVTVTHHGKRRHYPLTPEIGVLLAGDVRRGAFD